MTAAMPVRSLCVIPPATLVPPQLPLPPSAAAGHAPAMHMYWTSRPCFLCGRSGHCDHREMEIAAAEAVRMRMAPETT